SVPRVGWPRLRTLERLEPHRQLAHLSRETRLALRELLQQRRARRVVGVLLLEQRPHQPLAEDLVAGLPGEHDPAAEAGAVRGGHRLAHVLALPHLQQLARELGVEAVAGGGGGARGTQRGELGAPLAHARAQLVEHGRDAIALVVAGRRRGVAPRPVLHGPARYTLGSAD